VILLVCVLVPCGTYFPKGAEPANSQERRGVRARAKMKSFWKRTRSERGGRSPKPRRGASFHCCAAGRERSEVPRLSARVRTQGVMKNPVSKDNRKTRVPATQQPGMQGSAWLARLEGGRRGGDGDWCEGVRVHWRLARRIVVVDAESEDPDRSATLSCDDGNSNIACNTGLRLQELQAIQGTPRHCNVRLCALFSNTEGWPKARAPLIPSLLSSKRGSIAGKHCITSGRDRSWSAWPTKSAPPRVVRSL